MREPIEHKKAGLAKRFYRLAQSDRPLTAVLALFEYFQSLQTVLETSNP